jgi:glycosyltransferase involved in cell wall biosynthesis
MPRYRVPEVNLVQGGAVNWVWDRFDDAMHKHLDADVLTTPDAIPGAGRYFFFAAAYCGNATEEMLRKSVVLVNHLDPYGPESLEAVKHFCKDALAPVVFCKRYFDVLSNAGLERVRLARMAVDTDTFCLGPYLLKPEYGTRKVRVGISGRWYDTGRKGDARIVETAAILAKKGRPVVFSFCGPRWEPVIAAIRQAGGIAEEAKESCHYERYPSWYRSLDALLCLSHVEGGPMGVLEALACGCPVVSTDVGLVPELVTPTQPFVSIVKDAGEAARALLAVADKPTAKVTVRASVLDRTWRGFVAPIAEVLGVKMKG